MSLHYINVYHSKELDYSMSPSGKTLWLLCAVFAVILCESDPDWSDLTQPIKFNGGHVMTSGKQYVIYYGEWKEADKRYAVFRYFFHFPLDLLVCHTNVLVTSTPSPPKYRLHLGLIQPLLTTTRITLLLPVTFH